MAGPAIGGLLAVISLRAPFFFYAGTLVIAGAVGLMFLRPVSKAVTASKPTESVAIPFRVVLSDERFRAACIANFASGWANLGVRSALVPILIVELLHREELWTGIAFAIAAVVQTIALGPAGTFVDKVGRKPAIIGSYALAAAVMLAIPFVGDLWVLIVLLCVFGIASAFMGTAPAAAVGDAAGEKSGQPVAVFSAISDLGAIIGPLAAGALLDSFSYPAAFGSAVILLAIASVYALRMPRRDATATATVAG
jgi:MFS family permease